MCPHAKHTPCSLGHLAATCSPLQMAHLMVTGDDDDDGDGDGDGDEVLMQRFTHHVSVGS